MNLHEFEEKSGREEGYQVQQGRLTMAPYPKGGIDEQKYTKTQK